MILLESGEDGDYVEVQVGKLKASFFFMAAILWAMGEARFGVRSN